MTSRAYTRPATAGTQGRTGTLPLIDPYARARMDFYEVSVPSRPCVPPSGIVAKFAMSAVPMVGNDCLGGVAGGVSLSRYEPRNRFSQFRKKPKNPPIQNSEVAACRS